MYMHTALITALLFVFLPIQGAFAALFINNPNMRTVLPFIFSLLTAPSPKLLVWNYQNLMGAHYSSLHN